jgi:hypothetical protein
MFSGRFMVQKAYHSPKGTMKYWQVENKQVGGTEYAYASSEAQAKKLVSKQRNVPLSALRAREDDSILAKLVAIR